MNIKRLKRHWFELSKITALRVVFIGMSTIVIAWLYGIILIYQL